MNEPFENQPPQPSASPFEDYSPTPEAAPSDTVGMIEQPAAPAVGGGGKGAKIKEFFGRPWRGQEKLWKVYWLYGVLGSIGLQIVSGIVGGILGVVGGILLAVLYLAFGVWNGVSLWRCAWNASAKIWGIIVRILVVISIPFYIIAILMLFGVGVLGGVADSATPVSAPMAPTVSPEPVAPVAAPAPMNPMSAAPAAPMDAPVVPVAPAPVAVPAPAAPASAPAMDACEKQMRDYATQNGADANAYVAQNAAWLAQCRAAQPKP